MPARRPRRLRRSRLGFIDEPLLRFGHGQMLAHPKDGLFMFGPLEERRPAAISIGVIGTEAGIVLYRRWADRIEGYFPAAITKKVDDSKHAPFPGFQAAFGLPWPKDPLAEIEVEASQLHEAVRTGDRHRRTRGVVKLYADPILKAVRDDDARPSIWFVVIPDEVKEYCRPMAPNPSGWKPALGATVSAREARNTLREPFLLDVFNKEAEIYQYEPNFHHQLKAVLLRDRVIVQIVQESVLKVIADGPQPRKQDPATIAWNMSTAAFFKAGGRPWRLASVRDGVCYVGVVFKSYHADPSIGNACCAAQMFMGSGEGLVFKGAVGPWYSATTREYHLTRDAAEELIGKAVSAYKDTHGGFPAELFIHGKVQFNDDEWEGFQSAVPTSTKLVGVRIDRASDLKLFRRAQSPVLRGTYYQVYERRGYLWTGGFVPRLDTYAGREVPRPLGIEVCKGEADLALVMQDIQSLTKVNFNTCQFADGQPVTLRFADAIGEVLTSTPEGLDPPPLPFSHYI